MDWQIAIQGGMVGLLTLFLYGFRVGWWRTKWEVDAILARAERAEKQVDTLLPAVRQLTDAIEKISK